MVLGPNIRNVPVANFGSLVQQVGAAALIQQLIFPFEVLELCVLSLFIRFKGDEDRPPAFPRFFDNGFPHVGSIDIHC